MRSDVVNDTKPYRRMAKLTVKLTRITKRNKAKLCIKNLTEYKWHENTKANENDEITKTKK